MQTVNHWVDGGAYAGQPEDIVPVMNPALGRPVRQLSLASGADVDHIVARSLDTFGHWSEVPAPKRASILLSMRDLLIRNTDRLARIIGEEHGKTVADAKGEILRGIEVVEFAAGVPHLMKGDHSANVGGAIDIFSLREPVGVVAGITPFNFPVMIPLWMGSIAIASGCTFVNKPSERDPSAPMYLAQLWREAGLPDGVWNVLHGDKRAVDALLDHPDIEAVSFVGSTPVGEYIYRRASANCKRVQAFGGAKNHMIIMPDADLDQAADALVSAGYGSAGERCMAISVAVPVGEETAQLLLDKLRPRIAALKIGIFSDEEADFGPLITAAARDRVEALIDSGVKDGAELVIDGRSTSLQGYEDGYFVGSTLFDRVTPDMEIYREEIFGPVLSIVRAEDFGHAVEIVRGNEYGNGVALFTRDGDTAREFTRRVDVGMVGINVPIPVPMSFHHFGGAKRSKFGDTQMYGPDSFKFFTKMKTVSQRWPSSISQGASLAFAPGS
jgi:malonate-semialdehyde dehydrogenase (acetylating)/methylmalonate-semialdehyde dehydrogenase